ncbi:ferritin-like domain-containing protein [Nitrogeniibacter aestuarii]|uniref:ferritin-like domain-containing protein n=1 Tax=Nitrogeniibacter aestuarii TaxID=2815343 RepID=UPI001E28E136|nr:ferritin-like domain-containing protein [Nitrogeniibacter aestuarii]
MNMPGELPREYHCEKRDPSKFLSDVQTLRKRAREQIMEGAVTHDYGIDPAQAISVLNAALATELVCVMRYRQHYYVAKGIHAEPVANEFLTHSNEELGHVDQLAKRIVQLGGTPDMDPANLTARAHAEYVEAPSLIEMIRENLVAERIAVESYREMISFFGDKDPTTRTMLEGILAMEEEHADELADLLEDD